MAGWMERRRLPIGATRSNKGIPNGGGGAGGNGRGGGGGGGSGRGRGGRGDGGGGAGSGFSSLQLIGSHDFAASPTDTVDFTTTSISEVYLVLSQALIAVGSTAYGIRVSDDGGVTFYDTAGDYHNTRITSIDLLDETTSTMLLWGAASTINPNTMFMRLYPLNTARPVHSKATGNIVKGSTVPGVEWGNSAPAVVGPFNAIRFISTGGNVTAGTLYVYKKVVAP